MMRSDDLIWDIDCAMFNLTLSFDNGPVPEVTHGRSCGHSPTT